MTELKEYKYVFIETVYKDSDDTTEVLEFVVSDECFRDVEFYRCSLSDAEKIYHELEGTGAVLDFSFSDGFLKCGSNVKEAPINNLVKGEGFVGKLKSNNNVYDLLSLGSYSFVFLADGIAEKESYVGGEVRAFSSVQFSKSTMTVYVPMLSDKGLYNKIIIALGDNFLQFRHFKFGVPEDYGQFSFPGCVYIKNMSLNNKEYRIYNTYDIALYDTEVSLRQSSPLINKAMCLRERNAAGRYALRALRKSLARFANMESEKLMWDGGNRSYKSDYGVTFQSSMPKFGETEYTAVQNFILEQLGTGKAPADVKKEIYAADWASNVKYAALCILPVVSAASDNVVEDIALIDNLLDIMNRQILTADIYLYRVRANSYVRHIHLMNGTDIRIFGGNESDITYVTEGFYYD